MTTRYAPARRAAVAVAVLAAAAMLVPLAGPMSASADAAKDEPSFDGRPQFADLIEKNSPAVVNIRTTVSVEAGAPRFRGAPGQSPFPYDEFFRRFFGDSPHGAPAMPRGHGGSPKAMGQGSGFIIGAEGYIVTNNHVIENADEISVIRNDGSSFDAKLVGSDPKTDLALLKIDAEEPLPFVSFGDSDAARTGDWVIAIGNPFGLGGTATAGIISARGRDLQSGPYDDFIQIDAPINRGNSGGPVFNTAGEVIGVNTMIYSPNGGNVGIGFAIPAAMATEIVADLKANGSVERGWLGVQIQSVTEEIADGLGLDESKGALVAGVEPDSPAEKAGLKSGDVILDFDGKDVESVKALSRLVAATSADESVEVGIWRDGKRRERDVRIGSQEPQTVRVAGSGTVEPGKLGMELSPLTADARRYFRIPEDVDGALVARVHPEGPAAEKGLRPGDVITMVGQQTVSTPAEVHSALDAAADDDRDHVLFRVERAGTARFVALRLA